MSWDAIDVVLTMVIQIDGNNMSFHIVKVWFLRTNFQQNNV